jgi:hypothetical protein
MKNIIQISTVLSDIVSGDFRDLFIRFFSGFDRNGILRFEK